MSRKDSKRSRGESSRGVGSSSGQQRSDEDYPNFHFIHNYQWNRLNSLKVRDIIPTRWINSRDLNLLGIREETRALFSSVGMGEMFNMHHDTYEELTLEFLCTLDIFQAEECREGAIQFELMGKVYVVSYTDLGAIFGLRNVGRVDFHLDFPLNEFWTLLTGERVDSFQHLSLNKIHHPAIRIWCKFMANTINAKSESNKANTFDLQILASHFRSTEVEPLNLVRLLITSFSSITKNPGYSTPILLGGLITRIAIAKINYEEAPIHSREITTLSIDHFVSSRWIKKGRHSYTWKTQNGPEISLPATHLPSLASGLPTYCFPVQGQEQIPQEHQPHVPTPQQYFSRQVPDPANPSASSSPSFNFGQAFYDINVGMRNLMDSQRAFQQDVRNQFQQQNVRFDRLEQDSYLAMYPSYHHHVQGGYIPPMGHHPSWYPYQDMGGQSFPTTGGAAFQPTGRQFGEASGSRRRNVQIVESDDDDDDGGDDGGDGEHSGDTDELFGE